MPTVFVTQETTHDFTKAEVHGNIEFITKDDFNNVQNSLVNRSIIVEINHKLKKFDDSEDWIIITGSPYVSAAVFMALGNKGVKSVNVLRWDNRNEVYHPVKLDLTLSRTAIPQ
jgi:CRISPR/Cas system-associated endoribonuclease Cas2